MSCFDEPSGSVSLLPTAYRLSVPSARFCTEPTHEVTTLDVLCVDAGGHLGCGQPPSTSRLNCLPRPVCFSLLWQFQPPDTHRRSVEGFTDELGFLGVSSAKPAAGFTRLVYGGNSTNILGRTSQANGTQSASKRTFTQQPNVKVQWGQFPLNPHRTIPPTV